MEEKQINPQEEKEEGELEEGELEEDEGEKEEEQPEATVTSPQKEKKEIQEVEDKEVKDVTKEDVIENKEEKSKKKKESREERKRKHKDDDEEKEKEKKKKKKKREHVSSEEEENDIVAGPPKFHNRRVVPPPFDDEMGFDAMLQQEMYLRGRSPPPGMSAYGPPGPYGPPHHGMFREDYDSFDSGSDSEMRMDQRRRRRHRRSRSRSRSPSRKNEAICMYYMHGSCQRGKSCPYSHDIQPQRKMELCKFYMMDCCAKREKCLYMHKDFPCKYYHTGVKCGFADKCKFSHETMSDATRNILLKHIELAPKDILGDFPRLTKEAAQMVVAITEAHRNGKPLDVENMPGIMELRGRKFKYVDKAIKLVLKRQEERAKANNMGLQKEDSSSSSPEKRPRHRSDHGRHHDEGRHEHNTPKHRDEGPRLMQENVDSLVKAMRNQSYDKGRRNHDDWQNQLDRNRGDWMGNQREERSPTFMPYKNAINGDVAPRKGSPNADRFESAQSPNNKNAPSDQGIGNAPQNNPGKKLGGIMACMPQKQRDFFQRIQQQHSVHDDDDGPMDANADESNAGASNVNWYSSDEEGDGPSASKPVWQNPIHDTIDSPSRTPPGSHTPPGSRTPMYNEQLSPSDRKGDAGGGNGRNSNQSLQKNPFPHINFANININSSDLAIVLSAVKNQAAANASKSTPGDMHRDPRVGTSHRDSRDTSRDNHESVFDLPKESPRYQDQREMMPNQRTDMSYSNSWSRNSWGSDRSDMENSKDVRGMRDNFSVLKSPDQEQQRTGDIDLRILPRADSGRKENNSSVKSRFDTDMRMSSESTIYDVDLRQLGVPKTSSGSDEEMTSLPFKVPVHTPCKEIVASISSHTPMYYHLIKVTVPKPDFSNLKINKDDPRIMDDPRLRRMMRKNSTENSGNRSPRVPTRYELEGPMSPNTTPSIRNEPQQKFGDIDSRDPRMPTSRDPRSGDTRTDIRGEPRVDPRTSTRVDPRVGNRGDPRTEFREPINDMRNNDPRMSGMYPGGNNGNVMEGGMQYPNMGHGPGPPGPGRGMGPGPMQRVDPRGRPGLLGAAPAVPLSGNLPPANVSGGPGIPPYMMGVPMGPNMGVFYSDDPQDRMKGGRNFPPSSGPNWGGSMSSNDPRLHRDMGDMPSSYTPPPVS